MTNKKDDEPKDLTRIENLAEFLHQEDPDVDSLFQSSPTGFNLDENHDEDSTSTGIHTEEFSDLVEASEDSPPTDLPSEETNFESSEETYPQDESSPLDFSSEDVPLEETSFTDNSFSSETFPEDEALVDLPEEPSIEVNDEPEFIPSSSYEKFDEVKTFAETYAYGKFPAGGNPPFSIILTHIELDTTKESILAILNEFKLINDQNQSEVDQALSIGSLLIPQISEYVAIHLAHRFRRFECQIQFGLADEIRPSIDDTNPKGHSNRNFINQNNEGSSEDY